MAFYLVAALCSNVYSVQGFAAVDSDTPKVISVFPRAYSNQEINSCIQSVCGPAQGNISNSDALTVRENESATFTDFWTNTLEPKITEKFAIESANDQMIARELPKALAKGFRFDSPRGQMLQAVLGLRLAAEKVKVALRSVTHAENGEQLVNEKELAAYIAQQPANQRQAISLEFRLAYAVTMAPNNEVGVEDNAVAKRMKRLFPQFASSPELALQKDTASLLGIYSRIGVNLATDWQEQIVSSSEIAVIKRASASGKVADADSQRYIDVALNLQFYSLVFRKPNFTAFVRAGSETKKLIQAARVSSARAGLSKPLDKLAQKKSTIEVCRPRLAMNLAMNASELEIRKMREMSDAVKTGAKSVVNRLSKENPAVAAAIDRVQFIYPESSLDKRNIFVSKIDAELAHERSLQRFASESPQEMSDLILMNLVVDSTRAGFTADPQAPPRKSQIELTCLNLRQDAVSDYSATSKGFVEVSWFAVNYPEVGLPLMAHELGHVVSYVLRNDSQYYSLPFAHSLTCVGNRSPYVEYPIEMANPNQDSPTQEEDFADHFSALVMNELTAQGNPWMKHTKNLGCALVNDVGGRYTQNKFEPADGDVHSSGLMRLLMTAVDRGQMTSQCAPLVEYAKSAERELTCQ